MKVYNQDYFKRIIPKHLSDDSKKECLCNAYEQAADIRKFEIELFWSRGTYYWAFILAAFTAHFSLLGILFTKGDGMELSLFNLWSLNGLSLLALTLTAFFCFMFSFSWVLVNKGSKYWQQNWERHIDELEYYYTGNLHKTYLNTNYKKFSMNPLSQNAYDYSVTKITMVTSIILMIASFLLSFFYVILLVSKFFMKEYNPFLEWFTFLVVPGILLILLIIMIIVLICCKGANFDYNSDDIKNGSEWYTKTKSNNN